MPKTLAKHGQFFKGYAPPISSVSGSPFRVTRNWAMAGQEDVELVRMRYETSSAFTASTGGASYLQIKGNSIYRPYPGNTDSPAGYQRLYTQYARSIVLGARISVNLWSDTGAGVQQPFRIAVVPCTAAAYTIYSGYSNVTSLRGVPHATEALFSPGAKMPTVSGSGTTAQILLGFENETGYENLSSAYYGTSGADPSGLWYFLVGLQAMAGTTTLNAQLQCLIEFDVAFYQPIGTAVQQLNRWGNEEVPDSKVRDLGAREARMEVKSFQVREPEDYELVALPLRQSRPATEGAGVPTRSPGALAAPGSVGGVVFRSTG